MSNTTFNCPFGIGHVCEHAVGGTQDGQYVPCVHLQECQAQLHNNSESLQALNEALHRSNTVLRGIIDKQAAELHKLRDQIYREGAARA
jgi:hypothetical protein